MRQACRTAWPFNMLRPLPESGRVWGGCAATAASDIFPGGLRLLPPLLSVAIPRSHGATVPVLAAAAHDAAAVVTIEIQEGARLATALVAAPDPPLGHCAAGRCAVAVSCSGRVATLRIQLTRRISGGTPRPGTGARRGQACG